MHKDYQKSNEDFTKLYLINYTTEEIYSEKKIFFELCLLILSPCLQMKPFN